MEQNILKKIEGMTLETLQLETGDQWLDKHFGLVSNEEVSNSDLIHRIVSSRAAKKAGKLKHALKAATAFTVSRATVLELMKQAMEEEASYLADWLSDESDGEDWVVEKEFDFQIGKGFFDAITHEWNAGAAPCSAIRVVLKKTDDANLFKVRTVYPIQTESDKIAMENASNAFHAMASCTAEVFGFGIYAKAAAM